MTRPVTTPRRVLRREVVVLCATEITNWGALYYALPVAAGTIATDRGWPLTDVLGAFTLAQLVAGVCGLWVGRHIDRSGPRLVMTIGSVVGAAALVSVGLAQTPVAFYGAWAVAGAAMSATLYPPAFAAITGWTCDDHQRRLRALTAVTLVAGLASTAFAPLTGWLLAETGWRHTYLALAGVVAATGLAHAWGLREPWPRLGLVKTPELETEIDDGFRRADFWLLVVGTTLAGFCISAVVVNLVPMLTEQGIAVREAALVLGIGGIGQVTGRVFYVRLARVTTPWGRAWALLSVFAITTAALGEVHAPFLLVAALALTGGMARGLFTLVQATAVSERWGHRGFGARNGVLSGTTMVAAAFAPWVGGLLAVFLGGYAAAFWCLAGLSLVAAVVMRPLSGGSDALPHRFFRDRTA